MRVTLDESQTSNLMGSALRVITDVGFACSIEQYTTRLLSPCCHFYIDDAPHLSRETIILACRQCHRPVATSSDPTFTRATDPAFIEGGVSLHLRAFVSYWLIHHLGPVEGQLQTELLVDVLKGFDNRGWRYMPTQSRREQLQQWQDVEL